jgi:hypothetical protein
MFTLCKPAFFTFIFFIFLFLFYFLLFDNKNMFTLCKTAFFTFIFFISFFYFVFLFFNNKETYTLYKTAFFTSAASNFFNWWPSGSLALLIGGPLGLPDKVHWVPRAPRLKRSR